MAKITHFELELPYYTLTIDPRYIEARFNDGSLIYLDRIPFLFGIHKLYNSTPFEKISEVEALTFNGDEYLFDSNTRSLLITLVSGTTLLCTNDGLTETNLSVCPMTDVGVIESTNLVGKFTDEHEIFTVKYAIPTDNIEATFGMRFIQVQQFKVGGNMLENYKYKGKIILSSAKPTNYETLDDIFVL